MGVGDQGCHWAYQVRRDCLELPKMKIKQKACSPPLTQLPGLHWKMMSWELTSSSRRGWIGMNFDGLERKWVGSTEEL